MAATTSSVTTPIPAAGPSSSPSEACASSLSAATAGTGTSSEPRSSQPAATTTRMVTPLALPGAGSQRSSASPATGSRPRRSAHASCRGRASSAWSRNDVEHAGTCVLIARSHDDAMPGTIGAKPVSIYPTAKVPDD